MGPEWGVTVPPPPTYGHTLPGLNLGTRTGAQCKRTALRYYKFPRGFVMWPGKNRGILPADGEMCLSMILPVKQIVAEGRCEAHGHSLVVTTLRAVDLSSPRPSGVLGSYPGGRGLREGIGREKGALENEARTPVRGPESPSPPATRGHGRVAVREPGSERPPDTASAGPAWELRLQSCGKRTSAVRAWPPAVSAAAPEQVPSVRV